MMQYSRSLTKAIIIILPLTISLFIDFNSSLFNHLHFRHNMNKIFVLVLLLLVFGAINTIQLKLQNIHVLDKETGEKFYHPFMQTILLFIGEMMVGIVYFIQRAVKKYREKQEKDSIVTSNEPAVAAKPPAPITSAIFPALMDLLSTLLSYMALNLVDSSVWQISRGGVIVTTAILSRVILKRTFTRRAIVGCSLAFIGITTVQVVSVLSNGMAGKATVAEQLIGLGLLFVSILFNSFGLIVEKKVFDKHELDPLKMVFMQGVIGTILMGLLTFGFQYIECPWSNKAQCVCIGEGQYYIQNYTKYFNDLDTSNFLIFLTVGFICSIAISVPIGTILSKQVSPISRSLANVSRTLLIWLFGIIMTFTYAVDHPEYNLESRSWVVNVLKGLGFFLLMTGTALYHDKKKPKQEVEIEENENDEQQTSTKSQYDDVKSTTTMDSDQIKEEFRSYQESLTSPLVINSEE